MKPRSVSTISADFEPPLHLAVKGTDEVRGLYTLFILYPNICRSQRQHVHVQRKEYVLSEAPRGTTSMTHQGSVRLFSLNGRQLSWKKLEDKKCFKTGNIRLINFKHFLSMGVKHTQTRLKSKAFQTLNLQCFQL